MIIKDTPGKYEISDYGRVLTILQAEPSYEGNYFCKGKGKTESGNQNVYLNVTCKFSEFFSQNISLRKPVFCSCKWYAWVVSIFGKSSSVNLTLTWVWISPSPYVYSCPDSSGRQSDEGYNGACRKRRHVSLWCLLPPRWVTPKSTKVEEKWSRSDDWWR